MQSEKEKKGAYREGGLLTSPLQPKPRFPQKKVSFRIIAENDVIHYTSVGKICDI